LDLTKTESRDMLYFLLVIPVFKSF